MKKTSYEKIIHNRTFLVDSDELEKNPMIVEVKPRDNEKMKNIRVGKFITGDPMLLCKGFVGIDIATAAGFKDPESAVKQYVDWHDRFEVTIKDGDQYIPKVSLINLIGVICLFFKLPRHKAMKKMDRLHKKFSA